MRRPLVMGNWKMYGSLAHNRQWTSAFRVLDTALQDVDVAIAPPAPYLADLASQLPAEVVLAAQDVSAEQANGAFTGQVSAEMLVDFGVRYVIVGHSERRALQGESDALVAGKVQAVLAADLTPVVCVGETLEERDAGNTLTVVARQLGAVTGVLSPEAQEKLVIAYEPVWAIGTGKTAGPAQAQEVHGYIRSLLSEAAAEKVRILYGGSVKPENAQALFAEPDIDGALVGGASLDAQDFKCICDSAQTSAPI